LIKAANDGMAGKYFSNKIGLSLFDMQTDPVETTNVIDKYPEIAEKLKKFAEQHKERFYSKK
jgi:hypothetical protein